MDPLILHGFGGILYQIVYQISARGCWVDPASAPTPIITGAN